MRLEILVSGPNHTVVTTVPHSLGASHEVVVRINIDCGKLQIFLAAEYRDRARRGYWSVHQPQGARHWRWYHGTTPGMPHWLTRC